MAQQFRLVKYYFIYPDPFFRSSTDIQWLTKAARSSRQIGVEEMLRQRLRRLGPWMTVGSASSSLWWTTIAIENGPVEIVDLPINSMVDLSMAKCDSSQEGSSSSQPSGGNPWGFMRFLYHNPWKRYWNYWMEDYLNLNLISPEKDKSQRDIVVEWE